MPPTAYHIPLPISPESIQSHPALQFYAAYGQIFPQTEAAWAAQLFDEFYAEDCRTVKVDGSVINGGKEGWEGFRKLYAPFPNISRDLISVIIVSDDDKGTHTMHTEFMTKLPVDGGKGVVELPQAFVYTLGKADEGKGTLGWQIRELRNYYDLGTWERAARRK